MKQLFGEVMTNEELKRCPFCGSEEITMMECVGDFYLQCDICQCERDTRPSKAEAIIVWNQRAILTRPIEVIGFDKGSPDGDVTVKGYWANGILHLTEVIENAPEHLFNR
jgi:Lar family restriction alleviation protein